MSINNRELLFNLEDKPPATTSLFAGLQHLMAIFGGIITAPLIISRGMGLSAQDSNYLITSSLFISGIATLVQVNRVGIIGSGLLSVMGTSFTFIGAILFAFFSLPEAMLDAEKLGIIFGTSCIAALIVLPLSYYINHLRNIFTPTVAGATIVLLGLSLVWTNLDSLASGFLQATSTAEAWQGIFLAASVFGITLFASLSNHYWLRMTSIVIGLGVGFAASIFIGIIDFSLLLKLDKTFLPEPFHFGFGFDWGIFFIIFPIFLVSMTESIGDLTATSILSKLPTAGPQYWQRVRGGLLADTLGSLLASVLGSFPNTTFSQNNGVIRLTGIASRRIGMITASLLIIMGLFPVIGGLFQLLPNPVLSGATLLMFSMVALAGFNILRKHCSDRRAISIAISAILGGLIISQLSAFLPFLHPQLLMLLQFPVSTGAFLAIMLEVILPRPEPLSQPA